MADREVEQPNPPEGAPHDAVGAYLLDALPEEERAAFEAHLAACPSCQTEVAQLTPVVALLPRLLELDLDLEEEAGSSRTAPPAPSPDLRDRILTAARVEGRPAAGPAVVQSTPVGTVPEQPERVERTERTESPFAPGEPIAFPTTRARGRIRGGVGTAPATPWETISRINAGWLAAAALAVVAVGAIIWALALQGRIDDKDRELAAIRDRSNASAWHLDSGSTGGAGQSGTFLFSLPDQTGALVVRNMPELPPDKVYQSWLIKGSNAPEPGPTFTVDASGTGSAPITNPDATVYNVMAVTEEPTGGSEAPTSDILLAGNLDGAAGALPGLGIAAIRLTPPGADQSS